MASQDLIKSFMEDLMSFQRKVKKTPLKCENDVLSLLLKLDILESDKTFIIPKERLEDFSKIRGALNLYLTNLKNLENMTLK